VTVPAAAVKVAELAPAAAVTEAGTVSRDSLSENATASPPVGAARFRATVHVAVAWETTLVGLQVRAEISTGAPRLKVVVWEVPFRVAVMVAD